MNISILNEYTHCLYSPTILLVYEYIARRLNFSQQGYRVWVREDAEITGKAYLSHLVTVYHTHHATSTLQVRYKYSTTFLDQGEIKPITTFHSDPLPPHAL